MNHQEIVWECVVCIYVAGEREKKRRALESMKINHQDTQNNGTIFFDNLRNIGFSRTALLGDAVLQVASFNAL